MTIALLDGAMRVVQDTSDLCVIHSGGSSLGWAAAVFGGAIIAGALVASRFFPSLKERIGNGSSFIFPLIMSLIVFPLMFSGESNTVKLSRASNTLAVSQRKFLVFSGTKTYPLDQIFNASNTGRYNQLRINFTDGAYSNIGYDTTDGGRAEAAAAINDWLTHYRGRSLPLSR